MVVERNTTNNEIRSHLQYIENSISDMRIKRDDTRANDSRKQSGEMMKISRSGFLNSQRKHESADDYVMNLITRPSRKASTEIVRPKVATKEEFTPTASETESSSEPIPQRHQDRHLENAIQLRLYDEKRRLEGEYRRSSEMVKRELEELRHKRVCDKETYKEELARYEQDLNELKAFNKSLEDANLRSMRDLDTSEKRVTDLRNEVDRLNREIERYEAKMHKHKESLTEYEGKYNAERHNFETKLAQYEKTIDDMKEVELKLRSKEERSSYEIQALKDEVLSLKTELAESKSLQEKLKFEIDRLAKRHDNEKLDNDRVVASCHAKIQELTAELEAEKERIQNTTVALRAKEHETLNLKQSLAEKERDSRELKSVMELHEGVAKERMSLQSQVRAMSDQVEQMRSRLLEAEQNAQGAIQRAENAESTNHALRKKIEALQVQCSKTIITRGRSDTINTLTDADGTPISRLRSAHQPTKSRSVWWFEEEQPKAAYPGHCADMSVVVPQRAPSPYELTYSRTAPPSIVAPVARAVFEETSEGLALLTAEKKELQRRLAKMSTNAAYRTTDENELWDKIKARIGELDREIALVDPGDGARGTRPTGQPI